MSRTYPLAFYNVDNGRDPAQVDRELRALLDWRPAILGLCETTSLALPKVDGYNLIRDRSTPGRDNIAAYTKANLELSALKWLDCKQTWTRTERPGTHPPRSILEFRAGRLMVWVHHQPPKGTDNVKASQCEGVDKLTPRMAPWTRDDWSTRTDEDKANAKAQARVVLWDANRCKGEGDYGPDTLARRIDGATIGGKIDCATYRGGEVKAAKNASYPSKANGVTLKSDHKTAFRFELVLTT